MSFLERRASRAARQLQSFVAPQLADFSITTISTVTDQRSQEQNSRSNPIPSSYFDSRPAHSKGNEHDLTGGPHANAVSYAPSQEDVASVQISAGLYAQLPPYLSIKRTKERGRGLWTNSNIPAGSVLIAIKPHMYALSRPQLNLYCTSCCASQPSTGFKICSKCKITHYCGTACQNADWDLHKQECAALHRWAASAPSEGSSTRYSVPPEAVRCLARMIWRRKKLGGGSTWWKELDAMQSRREALAQSVIDAQVHLAHAIVRYMGMSGQEELRSHGISDIGELVELISKFTLNSFTLTSPSLSPIGVSLAPLAGLLNHSCDPNVAVVFPRVSKQEPELQIVAIRFIPANSELFTSYVDVTLPTSQRRRDLRETYNFICSCSVCMPPPDCVLDDWRERMWCPNSCGGSCHIPTGGDELVRCSTCRASIKDISDILDLLHTGEQALDKATGLQSPDPEAALRLVQNMVRTLGTRFPPSAHPLLALIRLGQNLLITQLARDATYVVVETAVQFAMAYVKGLSSILPHGHPVRAVAITELGKLLAVDEPVPASSDACAISPLIDKVPLEHAKGVHELQVPKGPARLKRAVEVLQQAYIELCVAFGRTNGGGEVGKSVREMLVGMEKELGVWKAGIRDTLEDALAQQRTKSQEAK